MKTIQISVCFMKILGWASFSGPCVILIPVWIMLSPTTVPTCQVLTQFSLCLARGFYFFRHFYPSHSREKKSGIESNFPCCKVVGEERNILFLGVMSQKASLSGHTSIPSLHFYWFEILCPEGNVFRYQERLLLIEIKSLGPFSSCK